MKRRFALATLLVLALLGVGTLVTSGRGDDGESNLAADPDRGPADATDAGPGVLAGDEMPAAIEAPPAPARVATIAGAVERRPPGGDWVTVTVGDSLSPADGFRTGVESTAVLAIGSSMRVEVTPETEFTVSSLTDTVSGLRLAGGRIAARVEKRGRSELRIEVADGDAVAETEAGEFTALTSGRGDLSVAASAGQVRLSARGSTVKVEAGQQSVAGASEPPSPPRAIPSSLFLKVKRPGEKLRRRDVRLAGTTSPGAIVTVNGVTVPVDSSGRFEADIELAEGRNRVVFRAVDPSGREEKQRVPLEVDSQGPRLKSEVRWQ